MLASKFYSISSQLWKLFNNKIWSHQKRRIALLLAVAFSLGIIIITIAMHYGYPPEVKDCKCVHGACLKDGTCSCREGYKGDLCTEPVIENIKTLWIVTRWIFFTVHLLWFIGYITLGVLLCRLENRRTAAIIAIFLWSTALFADVIGYGIDAEGFNEIIPDAVWAVLIAWVYVCIFPVYSMILYEWAKVLKRQADTDELSSAEYSVLIFNCLHWLMAYTVIANEFYGSNRADNSLFFMSLDAVSGLYVLITFIYRGSRIIQEMRSNQYIKRSPMVKKITRMTVLVVVVLFITIIVGSISITAFQRGKESWKYIAYQYSLLIVNSVLSGFLLGYYFNIYRFLRANELAQSSGTKVKQSTNSVDLELSRRSINLD